MWSGLGCLCFTKDFPDLTSSQANLDEGHPVSLDLHALCLELEDLPVGEEYLEVAVTACTNGDNVFHGDSILESSLPWVKYEELVGGFATCLLDWGEGGGGGGGENEGYKTCSQDTFSV